MSEALIQLMLASATDTAQLCLATATETSPPTHSAFLSAAGFLPAFLLKIISFATISLPLSFYRILTWSFTVHLNFSTLLVILGIVLMAAYLVVRYRFLTMYSRLKPIEPPKSASSFDLHPDSPEDLAYSDQGFKNYPDEFLSAFLSSIKIFGYLEQPVFHELARHLQTRKLLAGDTLHPDEEREKSFYIVVDGHVQLFLKPDDDDKDDSCGSSLDHDILEGSNWRSALAADEMRNDGFKNYTLINEVGGGSTLSSLFIILSIFCESMKRNEEKEMKRKIARGYRHSHQSHIHSNNQDHPFYRQQPFRTRIMSQDSPSRVFPNIESNSEHDTSPSDGLPASVALTPPVNASPRDPLRNRSASMRYEPHHPSYLQHYDMPSEDLRTTVTTDTHSPSTLHASNDSTLDETMIPEASLPHFDMESELTTSAQTLLQHHHPVHPNIIARATTDTTLAVIPGQAFHKLFQKFPKAAAHIVQVIVTRFHRVTLCTSHDYLGLTKELLRIEQHVHESVCLQKLPRDFGAPGAIDRLRNKFSSTQPEQQGTESSVPKDASAMPVRLSENDGLMHAVHLKDDSSTETIPSIPAGSLPQTVVHSMMDQPQEIQSPPHSCDPVDVVNAEYSVEDNLYLRASVMDSIAELLGITTDLQNAPPIFSPRSECKSRGHKNAYDNRYYPMDLFSHSGTVDSSGSPSLNPLYSPLDNDGEPVSKAPVAQSKSHVQQNSADKDELFPSSDLQILYFPKDAVLVKEHETGTGLFFVIDGVLAATMAPSESKDLWGQNASIKHHQNRDGRKKKKKRKHIHFSVSSSSSDSSLSPNDSSPQQSTEASLDKTPLISAVPFELEQKYGQTLASNAPAGRTGLSESAKKRNASRKKWPTFYIKPGGVAGYLSALTGYASFIEISAKTDTFVGYLSKKSLDRIIEKNPSVLLKLATHLVGALDPLILQIDIALEWLQVPAGQVLYREGQPSESIYMVIHGRLRTIRDKKEGELEIISEFGQGDTVGELEVLTEMKAPFTLHAIRDSELARMPKTLFNALALRHPEITLQISRMIAYRSIQLVMQKNAGMERRSENVANFPPHDMNPSSLASISASVSPGRFPEVYGRNNVNLKTIGILPVNSFVPIIDFAEHLKSALVHSVGASCILLNSATVTSVMGKYAFTRLGKLKMASWLAEQEEKYRIVLYLADSGVTSQWIRTCIRQADCILLVGLGDGDPAVGEYERLLINMKTTARKELVLLHRERFCASGTTEAWKKNRLWIQAHHHVYMPMKQSTTLPTDRFRPPWLGEKGRKNTSGSINVLSNVKDQLEKYYSAVPTFGRLLVPKKERSDPLSGVSTSARNDFARLARRLCGKSVALVLGGGGAKGISHIGLIQALEEAGIPIDIIGGTSIGSFVGGLYATNMDLVATIARTKLFSSRMSSLWRQIMDLTYPVTAWFTGHEFNRSIFKCFGESQIEDFWLPYFAVTTNITYSRMEVHTTGYAWRYIRASMSLSGYMPPICENGDMLVDGGYVDNLPVSVAKIMGADIIIAVDVATDDDNSPVYYGDSISGWWALLHSFNPFRTYNIPSIAEIQSRLAYVSSVPKLEEAKTIDGTLYVKLPVQTWGTLEFSKFTDIMQLGYLVGKQVVSRWRRLGYASGRLEFDQGETISRGQEVRGKKERRNSI